MLISVKYLFDVYFYVNLKNAVSFARFRSGFLCYNLSHPTVQFQKILYAHGFFSIQEPIYIFKRT